MYNIVVFLCFEESVMYNKLKNKFGKYAIVNLMKYVVMLYICGYFIYLIGRAKGVDLYGTYLCFDVDKILKGQVWRIVSWLIQAPDYDIFFLLISVWFYYFIGSTLEKFWGSFRFNLFYFSGVFFNVLAVVIIYIISEPLYGSYGALNKLMAMLHYYLPNLEYINLSMFLAFAVIFSEASVLLFFIIPIKIKYLAYIYVGVEIYNIVDCFLQGGDSWKAGVVRAILCVVSMLNFIIFYINAKKHGTNRLADAIRRRQYQTSYRRGEAENARTMAGNRSMGGSVKPITRHKCAVCGRTELDGDELEFRFCSKCEGNYEYCMDHLYTHTHVVRVLVDPDEVNKDGN